MKIVGVSVPVLTGDIARAIPRYEGLTGERVKTRFVLPDRRLTIALLGNVTLIAGDEQALAPMREVRATFIVDSIVDFETHLRSSGATILQAPSPTPMGRNMVARDAEGTVFEFVEPTSPQGP
jgi:predicted enzyme related to lactoylglutathione lyase